MLLFALGLSADCFGLVAQDKVETGEIARALSFGVDALRAGWNDFIALDVRETRISDGERVATLEPSRARTLIFRFLQFWQPALGLP